LKFLKGLARHNDREWFGARKDVFERELKAPMLGLIEEINHALEGFAPEYVRPPQKAMMRIYRDTRFSADKTPYKTQVSAWWSRQGLEKTSGAGFYLSFGVKGLVIAAGVFMPEREQLLAIRRHLIEHGRELGGLLDGKRLRTLLPDSEATTLTRPPKGFVGLDPEVMKLVMCKQWGVSVTLPAEAGLEDSLRGEIVKRYKVAAPVVSLLNAALAPTGRKAMF
jgi:uncharacterized protein (TIGR02453 family)